LKHTFLFITILLTILTSCAPAATSTPIPVATQEPQPEIAVTVVISEPTKAAPTITFTPEAERINPSDWKNWPVIPELSSYMLDVYAQGQDLGRDPQTVSIVGDCESSSDWFLKDFSKGERFYDLGPYASLQETIDYFNPSLGYTSYAALRGATAVTVLTPLWADPKVCNKGETPLGCEYRVHNPAFAIIALGTNDVHKGEQFEPKMRTIIEYTIAQGIVPILVTKADNLEGDESINYSIAKLASEYSLPVWNFWAAVQPLPGQGLQPDGAHLTFASNFFDNPDKLKSAWPVRNLTALQTLEAMRLAVQE
jgi:hypothetical protein